MNISISGYSVACYAAIVTTAGVLIKGYAVWRDRAKLKVLVRPNIGIDELINLGFEIQLLTNCIGRCIIQVINTGRRPIQLAQAEYIYDGKKIKCPYAWRPTIDLKEGDIAAIFIDPINLDLAKLTSVLVKDATGRSWKGSIPKEKK